ncbi:MAG: T9SS type A sorting domain-containing protein [Sphingobacteriales bacterium]
MKKILLATFLVICFLPAKSQTSVYFTGYTFYNSTTNKLQISYWICNPSGSNPNFEFANISFVMEWDPTKVTLLDSSFIPAKDGLDSSDYSNSNPDVNQNLSPIIHNGVSYNAVNLQRSTITCSNLLILNNGACIPFFVADFYIDPAVAAAYNFSTPSANNYIASFDNGSSASPIQFLPGSQLEDAGNSSNSCKNNLVKNTTTITTDTTRDVFNSSNSALPVRWLSFDVIMEHKNAVLAWQTAFESNNLGFEIQRKTNGKFEKIGFVPSKSYNGNSSNNISYIFTDSNLPENSVTYYRIKQIGADKAETYSEIKSIRNNSKSLQVLIYPNPSHGNVNVIIPDINGVTDINLVDFSGRLVKQWNSFKAQNLQLEGLKTGIYSLQISNRETGEKTSQKLTIL